MLFLVVLLLAAACNSVQSQPRDCSEVEGTKSNVYSIQPPAVQEPFHVYCDLETEGGGWTVFQRRTEGKINFYRGWEDYKHGFGNIAGEFWLGLERIHKMTNHKSYEIYIEMQDFEGLIGYARYSAFAVGPQVKGYPISVLGKYNGTAGDSLKYHASQKFSTFDRDNDNWSKGNCAKYHIGAWWYNKCEESCLNGQYFHGKVTGQAICRGTFWNGFKGFAYSLKETKMMVRPVSYVPPTVLLPRTTPLPPCKPPTVKPTPPPVMPTPPLVMPTPPPVKPTPPRVQSQPRDCSEVEGTKSNVYSIQPPGVQEPFHVYCDLETEGGGWTVFQRRTEGKINFYRGWEDYKHGFGNIAGEFWLGLERIHKMTNHKSYEIYIEMKAFEGLTGYARYSAFAIGPEVKGYPISVLGKYNGTAGDSFRYHASQKFTTFDKDNDNYEEGNCAKLHTGAWWYDCCDHSNLNGKYLKGDFSGQTMHLGMVWNLFKGNRYSVKETKMMIRPLIRDRY